MIPTRLLRFLNRALQFLSDLQQSLNGRNANEVLADLFSQYLANVYTESQVSESVSVCVCVDEDIQRGGGWPVPHLQLAMHLHQLN